MSDSISDLFLRNCDVLEREHSDCDNATDGFYTEKLCVVWAEVERCGLPVLM